MEQLGIEQIVEQIQGLEDSMRTQIIDEVYEALMEAADSAESSEHAEGDEKNWGRDEAKGLRAAAALIDRDHR